MCVHVYSACTALYCTVLYCVVAPKTSCSTRLDSTPLATRRTMAQLQSGLWPLQRRAPVVGLRLALPSLPPVQSSVQSDSIQFIPFDFIHSLRCVALRSVHCALCIVVCAVLCCVVFGSLFLLIRCLLSSHSLWCTYAHSSCDVHAPCVHSAAFRSIPFTPSLLRARLLSRNSSLKLKLKPVWCLRPFQWAGLCSSLLHVSVSARLECSLT